MAVSDVEKKGIFTEFDISELSECKNKNAIFLIKAGLRMTPENYMEYLNKKKELFFPLN